MAETDTENIVNFESISFDPYKNNEVLSDANNDPDVNFYSDFDFSSLQTDYLHPSEIKQCDEIFSDKFSVLHLNIRSLNKNFEKFREFFSTLNSKFNVICFSETWASHDISKDSRFQLEGYNIVYQNRINKRGGGVSIFIDKSYDFKIRNDLCVNSNSIESLSIEILNDNKTKNIILNVTYRPPEGDLNFCEQYFRDFLTKTTKCKTNKNVVLAGDFNIDVLNFNNNKAIQNFVNLMFEFGMVLTTNKPTRITTHSISAIDHIITNCVVNDSIFKSGIIKTDISDHFPMFFSFKINKQSSKNDQEDDFNYKREFNNVSLNLFKTKLKEVNWDILKTYKDVDKAYNKFFEIFISIYDSAFPKQKIKIKTKRISSPWITKGILKSSKQKQRLYEKFLKNRTAQNEQVYKTYKNLFETIKHKTKKAYYSNILLKYKGDAKKTWQIMKSLIGKSPVKTSKFPKKIILEENEIFEEHKIAKTFNDFFSKVGQNLAQKIPFSLKSFESFMKEYTSQIASKSVTVTELKDAFFSLKARKSPGYDEVSFDAIRSCFGELFTPLLFIFNMSIETGIFAKNLKVAKVTPIYKAGEKTDLGNYRPISVLPCFSKILERIMHGRLHAYLEENKILYSKQFGFQLGQSTDHAIVQLVDQIYDSFDANRYTIGVFVDLSKAFDTVDHNILIKKLQLYGIKGKTLEWLKSYLTNRKQYIQIDKNDKTDLKTIKCGVPQGSILGPLLFLIYVNDLQYVSTILNPIMFADDTNLFYSHQDIKYLFKKVNTELQSINSWFISNKLSLNVGKTKFSFVHKPSKKDDIPIILPKLSINGNEIQRKESIKFLGVLLDENLNWKEHIKCTENKISKNIGILYKAKPFLTKECMLSLYYSYIHPYINYGNIAWASIYKTNLQKVHRLQKRAIRLVFNKNRFDHTRELFRSNNILNTYQVNILKNLMFMHQVSTNSAPLNFLTKFRKPSHMYQTRFSNTNYSRPISALEKSKYRISSRGPYLWNNYLSNNEKHNTNLQTFKSNLKSKILNCENEKYFF